VRTWKRLRRVSPLLCLLVACSSPGPDTSAWESHLPAVTVPSPEEEGRTSEYWKSKLSGLPTSCSQAELEAHLASIRGYLVKPKPPGPMSWVHSSGGRTARIVITKDFYPLDELFDLKVEWDDPEIPKGLRQAKVVGFPDLRSRIQPSLYGYFLAIQRIWRSDGSDFNPAALVRAVNLLQRLGPEDARRVLKEFFYLAQQTQGVVDLAPGQDLPVHGTQYTCLPLDSFKVTAIAEILFGEARRMPTSYRELEQHSVSTFFVKRGLLLAYTHPDLYAQRPEILELLWNPTSPFLAAPLSPENSALEIIEELTASPEWQRYPVVDDWQKGYLRKQALNAVESALPRQLVLHHAGLETIERDSWARILRDVHDLGIHWDESRQEFIPNP